MKRLTEDSVTGETYIKQCASSCPYDGDFCGTDECPVLNAVADKLGEYERAEEQGLFVRLPCKVGDLVFIIDGENICRRKVKSIKILSTAIEISTSDIIFHKESFGETVFLTREEAEKKLEEMKNEWLQRKSCRTFK